MSSQDPSASEVSVVALSRAVAKVTEYRALPVIDQVHCAAGFTAAERDAWKAAYLWRIGFTERWRKEDVLVRERDHLTWEAEEKYGTALVAEILNK